MSVIGAFNLLEDERDCLADRALARFRADWPAAAAAIGDADAFFVRAMESFIDTFVTNSCDSWDPAAKELLMLDATDPGALLDVPLVIARTVCERLVERAMAAEADRDRWRGALFDAEAAGRLMAVRLLALRREWLAASGPRAADTPRSDA